MQVGEAFVGRLASSHASGCPWKTVACDPGLEMFPPLDRRTVCAMFAQRQETLSSLNMLPPLSEAALRTLEASRRSAFPLNLMQCLCWKDHLVLKTHSRPGNLV